MIEFEPVCALNPSYRGKEGFRARQRKKEEVVWREEGQRERERE